MTGAGATDGWQLLAVLTARRKLFVIHISAPCFNPVLSSVRLGPHTKVLLCILGVCLSHSWCALPCAHLLSAGKSSVHARRALYSIHSGFISLFSLPNSRHGACLHRWAAKEQNISSDSLSIAQVRDRCSTLPSTSLTSQK